MKRIVVCADGTWNEGDQIDQKTGRLQPDNVTKVAALRGRGRLRRTRHTLLRMVRIGDFDPDSELHDVIRQIA
jgi:hypothetical protein